VFVDTDLLHSGANKSHRASRHAQEGANQLSRGPLRSRMFGDFAAAEAFHGKISAAHAQHIKDLEIHQEVLAAVGRKAHRAGFEFADMEGRNAAELRMV
jgi:Protein of unknown function (DUF2563)